MTKTVIFVEGNTELIFVREFLLKYFEWTNIEVVCFQLGADAKLFSVPYPFSSGRSKDLQVFDIINVGGGTVLPHILRREAKLWKDGCNKIIGLEDMYSEQYLRDKPLHSRKPDIPTMNKIIEAKQEYLQRVSNQPKNIYFHFAIMEVEAWFLGLHKCFATVDSRLTPEFIHQNCGFNLEMCNPETEFLHPKETVKQIFKTVNQSYKEAETPKTLLSNIEKSDFQTLSNAPICNTFTQFYQTITTN